jgi:zinc protease
MHGEKTEMKLAAALLAALAVVLASALWTGNATAGDVPERPEKIKYPSMKYDPPKAADYRVELKDGMVAYMVPDKSLPLVSVYVLMRLGPDQDPPGKEGLGSIMMGQLTRGGIKSMTAEELEDRVAFLGAQLDSRMGGGRRGMMGLGGIRTGPAESFASVNLLAKDLDEGLSLLAECLREPAFQEDRLQLAKDQLLGQMKERNDNTSSIERREWSHLMNGEGHWTNRWTTEASVSGITRDDMIAYHKRHIGPENFLFAVSGNFDKKEMKEKLVAAFGRWPQSGESVGAPAAPAAAPKPGWYAVDKDVNQARVSFGLPSLDRYDPDWYAAQVMNNILGGGGFTSRLVNRIRSDEGLAYSVRSSIRGGTYYAEPWLVTFQTKVRSTAYAIEIALNEITRMRDELVTDEELTIAKNNFIESLPVGFETANAIVGALALEELTGRYDRHPEYFVDYRDRIADVTAEDVQRVAKRLLDPEKMTFLIVGDVDDALLGDPKHDVSLTGLAGGEPTRIPLRDPMTMLPMEE